MIFLLLLGRTALGWAADTPPTDKRYLAALGPGDTVSMEVYGQPDMKTTISVADDGTISIPLAGKVQVAGLSSVDAGQRVEKALRDGQFLVDPHVTLTIVQARSQLVSVLGEVHQPGRYPIDSNTSVFDLLAQAGGVTEVGADVVFILRTDAGGAVNRFPINLKGLANGAGTIPMQPVHSGDSLYVPRAQQFYIYGEVTKPDMYRLESGMTVIQAIARAGGVTTRGSERRVEVKRAGKDGKYVITHAKLSDPVQPDDVINVKESIF
ncbi:MAG: SLBB domain-containing protein [Steroidobacteraceae bacterium]